MEPEVQKAVETVEDCSKQIAELDEKRRELASQRRKAIWVLTRTFSLAEIAAIAGMHRGAIHKDLSRHPEDIK